MQAIEWPQSLDNVVRYRTPNDAGTRNKSGIIFFIAIIVIILAPGASDFFKRSETGSKCNTKNQFLNFKKKSLVAFGTRYKR